MNRVRAIALVFATAVLALGSLLTDAAAQKTIKDPAEYNTYIAALNETDPGKKAGLMEAFVQQYPQSVVKVDALEQAMAAYQSLGNQQKVQEIATRILQLDPNNVRALAIVTFIERATANTAEKAAKARHDGEEGLAALAKWSKPPEITDAEFAKLKDQMTAIFAGAAGFGALQARDYAAARDYYLRSIKIDPADLQDVYQLAVADLEMSPIDTSGFWYIARAYQLAKGNAAAQKSISDYGKAKYKRYHGGTDGWDQMVNDAAGQTALPPGFGVKAAPTPAELAVQAVQQNAPEDLSFSDKEFILQYRDVSPANKDAADKIWASIQTIQKNGEARLSIPVKIISVTRDSIDAAISEDNQAANKADVHVVMEKPMLNPPAPNTETNIIGVLTSYTLQPFMFIMEHGELPGPKAR
jgi:tetratricopeptide (TPR) repeat protein